MSRTRQPGHLTVDEALAQAKKAVRQKRFEDAARWYEGILAQDPTHPVARKGLRKVRKTKPQSQAGPDPDAQQVDNLVRLYHAGRMDQAESACRTLLDAFPRSLTVLNILGSTQQVQGKLAEAVATFDRAIALQPGFADAWGNRGNALKDLGRLDEAIESYDRAIALKPDFAVACYNRGNALRDAGLAAEAAGSYEKAIAIQPRFGAAHRNLAMLKRFVADDPQIPRMAELHASPLTPDNERMELCFALGKAFEDLGEVDRSFAYLSEGNRLAARNFEYDIENDRRLFAEIKAIFAGAQPADRGQSTDPATTGPIFIVGMMRSGTSLTEQILASHSQVHGAGELEIMNRILGAGLAGRDFAQLRRDYLDAIGAIAPPHVFVTDKMPLNFRWVGFICEALPEAKIVHVKRHPIATCWSIFKHYFPAEGNGYACNLEHLAEYYLLYEDLMAFWDERYPGRIHELGYEALTENQAEVTRRLLDFCGLPWEDRCMAFEKSDRTVRTSSAVQVRKHLYTGSSEAWRPYARHLRVLTDRLGT